MRRDQRRTFLRTVDTPISRHTPTRSCIRKVKEGASIEALHSGRTSGARLCDYGGRGFQRPGICHGLPDTHRRIALEVETAIP